LAPRERVALTWAVAALLILTVFWLGMRPAWRTLQIAPQQLNQLDAQLQHMNQLAAQAKLLRAAPAVSSNQSAESLKAATDRLGAAAKLNLQGDRATVGLTGVSPEALAEFLREVRSVARARVTEAQLSRRGTLYGGTVVLTLVGSAP
jgi:general secretion pathway protein M